MISFFRRVSGIIMALLAAASLVISVFIIARIWQMRIPVTETLDANIVRIIGTLENTQAMLAVADDSLMSALDSVDTLHIMLGTISKSINDTGPMFASMHQLLDEDLPGTISSTQTSLEAAQSSARIIDAVLTSLNAIPFIQGDPYNPPVPLHESLGQISDSLGEMPASFDDINASLRQANRDMIALRVDLADMQAQLDTVGTNLENTQVIVENYQESLVDYKTSLESMLEYLPGWINRLVWLLTFTVLWLSVAQWGLLVQGLAFTGLYKRGKQNEPVNS
jgi:hypothetical protein